MILKHHLEESKKIIKRRKDMDKKIYGYIIKFDDGTYYGGCRKRNRKTLKGAMMYAGEKKAYNIIHKSINFPASDKDRAKVVRVELKES